MHGAFPIKRDAGKQANQKCMLIKRHQPLQTHHDYSVEYRLAQRQNICSITHITVVLSSFFAFVLVFFLLILSILKTHNGITKNVCWKRHKIVCVVYMENLSEYVHLYGIFERLKTIHTYANANHKLNCRLADRRSVHYWTIYLHITHRV